MFRFVFISLIALINGASIIRDAQSVANKRDEVDNNAEIYLPKSIQRLGKLGVNFDLDVNNTENELQNKPYINCMEYNFNTCQSQDPADCYKIKQCYQGTPTHFLGCMAVLVYNTLENGSHPDEHQHPHVMGCWTQDEREMAECQSENECVVDMRRTGAIERTAKFCCCRTHYCNSKFTYRNVGIHEPDEIETTTTTVQPLIDGPEGLFVHAINLALIPFLLICIAIACYIFTRTLRRKFFKKDIKQIQPASKGTEEPLIQKVAEITLDNGSKIGFKDIELLNEISNGRFGQVHRATLGDRILAVKIFPQSEENSWINEMQIYDSVNKAAFGNDSIAEFVGGFKWDKKYWMLTTFYEKSSLFDFLKANTVTMPESIKMISTMLDGLAFLHEEITSSGGSEKPIIVHRDLKSKNILVKDDLSTCITDFGLALKCEARGIPADQNHGQVGTRRYMSPEVLEGATEFSSFAFQQIDVYAAALVIWEVISRTAPTEGEEIPPYMLPYEKEIGSNPSTNQMRELVATQKFRPQVRMELLQNEISASIVRTMDEMWDHEPDGRITSSCARDRSRQWANEVSMSSIGTTSTSPMGP